MTTQTQYGRKRNNDGGKQKKKKEKRREENKKNIEIRIRTERFGDYRLTVAVNNV